jgi:conjugal transfer pilus assembly protein TraF
MFVVFSIHSTFASNEKIVENSTVSQDSFFNQRYRGWLWFEEKELEANARKRKQEITAEEADDEIETLKIEMDKKRSIMIARPTAVNVKEYVELEEIMWKRALALDDAYREAKFRYPELFDKLNDPTNVHAVKFKRKLDQNKFHERIKEFANKYDLVLFSKGSCPYCREFAPVLKHFSETYGFNTEEASVDGEMTGLFSGKTLPHLAKQLGIEATPTVIAISKDGKSAFEMIRGYVTTRELEEYTDLAINYSKSLNQKGRGNNG